MSANGNDPEASIKLLFDRNSGAQVTQVTKFATQVFESTYKWRLENFANFPDSLYFTEKIDIVGTKFYWVLQMKTVGGSSCCEGKFILSYHGRKIADDELKNSSCEFEAKIKNAVVWKQSLSQIAPMSITLLATHGQSGGQVVNVAGYLKDNPCLVFDIKVKIKTTRLFKDVTIVTTDMVNKLSDDFKSALLEGDELKDVSFKVEGKIVKAHKAILAARSPVFKKMFTLKMKETKENVVEVTDIKHDTLEEMLHFIYTGSVSELFPIVVLELFEAAHKYQIECLIKVCEIEMHQNLTEENAAAIHELSKIYDIDEGLKHEAFKLFKSNLCSQIANWEFGNDEKQKEVFSFVTQNMMRPTKSLKKKDEEPESKNV